MRINKFLAQCGVASRRHADVLVAAGHVKVNGEKITSPGVQIDDQNDIISVDDKVVTLVQAKTYVILNKPAGYLTSHSDPHHNKTVMRLLKDVGCRVNPIGRLDLDTQGALLFSDDGELAHRLTHPSYSIKKVYHANVAGQVMKEVLPAFQTGIRLPDGAIGKGKASILEIGKLNSVLEITLTEGRKREVKYMCQTVGYPVRNLTRVSFGGITCEGLKLGAWRHLSDEEIKSLRRLVKLDH